MSLLDRDWNVGVSASAKRTSTSWKDLAIRGLLHRLRERANGSYDLGRGLPLDAAHGQDRETHRCVVPPDAELASLEIVENLIRMELDGRHLHPVELAALLK